MIERGKIRIVATPEGATSAEEMFRTIPTPSYLVGLRPRHFEALMRLGSDEEKVERLYSGADDIWKGDDFCDLEDGWAAIHMILNRTPPIDSSFPWDRGEPPLLYALRGTQGVLQGEGMLRDGSNTWCTPWSRRGFRASPRPCPIWMKTRSSRSTGRTARRAGRLSVDETPGSVG